jgi:hypothetical protein
VLPKLGAVEAVPLHRDDLGQHFDQSVLHELERRQRLSELVALAGVGQRRVVGGDRVAAGAELYVPALTVLAHRCWWQLCGYLAVMCAAQALWNASSNNCAAQRDPVTYRCLRQRVASAARTRTHLHGHPRHRAVWCRAGRELRSLVPRIGPAERWRTGSRNDRRTAHPTAGRPLTMTSVSDVERNRYRGPSTTAELL